MQQFRALCHIKKLKLKMTSLSARALLSVLVLAILVSVTIFVAAGTIDYWQAWVYVTTFTFVSLLTTLDLIERDPELLQRRMRGGPTAERRSTQKVIMIFTSLGFISLLVVPGLDRRLGWSKVPTYLVIAGDALVVLGFYLIFLVYRENTYTSATIEIAANQRVIDSGPYAMVRHPMYAGGLLYLLGTPLALGSYVGLVPFIAVVPFLIWRLFDEEKMLTAELAGYSEYQDRVKYRLVPRVW
jgi:protein-S-isoprenylcysteine O-methyltransferase Ste14